MNIGGRFWPEDKGKSFVAEAHEEPRLGPEMERAIQLLLPRNGRPAKHV